MALWFLRGLRRGIVTTRYPALPDPSAGLLPTPPAFRPELLTADLVDRLAEICPSQAISRDGALMRYDVGRCTACGRCLAEAGAAAQPSGHFELASTSRGQLVKTIRIAGDHHEP